MHIIIGLIFVLILVIVYLLTEDWFSPARIHTTMWVFIYFGYIIFSNTINLSYKGIIWIMVSCIVITIGELIGKKFVQRKQPIKAISNPETGLSEDNRLHYTEIGLTENNRIRPFPKYMWYILVLFFVFGIIGCYMEIRMYGYNLSVFFDLSKLLDMNNEIAIDRYSGAGKSSWIVTLMTAFRYGGSICGGYSLIYANRWNKKIACFLPLLASLINMMINNTKIGMISSATLFVIGFMASYMAFHKHSLKIKPKVVLIAIATAFGLLSLLIISMMFRTGSFDTAVFYDIKEKFVVYAFGNIESFDYWFSNVFHFGNYTWGTNTFMAPFSILGLVEKKQGIYDYYTGLSSNVYTGYRGVISDWGMIGGMIFVLLLGVIGGIAIMKIKQKGNSIGYITLYSVTMFFLINSFVISPWVYTTYWAAIVTFVAFLILANKKLFGAK